MTSLEVQRERPSSTPIFACLGCKRLSLNAYDRLLAQICSLENEISQLNRIMEKKRVLGKKCAFRQSKMLNIIYRPKFARWSVRLIGKNYKKKSFEKECAFRHDQ